MATKKKTMTKRATSNKQRPGKKAQRKRAPARKPRIAKPKSKMSALDAAAKVLDEAGEPLNSREMIERMAKKGYWTSPAGSVGASLSKTLGCRRGLPIRRPTDSETFKTARP